MTDREVPLASAHTADAIHAWLDGENVNEAQLHAAEKEYEFWRRVEAEDGQAPPHQDADLAAGRDHEGDQERLNGRFMDEAAPLAGAASFAPSSQLSARGTPEL